MRDNTRLWWLAAFALILGFTVGTTALTEYYGTNLGGGGWYVGKDIIPNQRRIGQIIYLNGQWNITNATFSPFSQNGVLIQNTEFRIETVAAGNPTGTLADANAYCQVTPAQMTAALGGWANCSFPTGVTLPTGSYAIVIRMNPETDVGNAYYLMAASPGSNGRDYTAGVWAAIAQNITAGIDYTITPNLVIAATVNETGSSVVTAYNISNATNSMIGSFNGTLILNPAYNTTMPTGVITVTITAPVGYETPVAQTTSYNGSSAATVSFSIHVAGLDMRCYDEKTLDRIYFTAATYNSTTTTTFSNIYNLTQNWANISYGAVTIAVSNAIGVYGPTAYYPRTYTINNGNTEYTDLNCFMLNASASAIYVRFHIRDITNQPIANATTQILRSFGGAAVVVGEITTDSSGDAAFYMELGAPYALQVAATGYLNYYTTITPSSNDYTITLTSATTGSTGLPINIYDDINWYILPSVALTQQVTNLTLVVYSSNDSLDYFGAAFYNSTGSLLQFTNVTGSPGGGVIYYSHNATNNTGNVTMTFWLRRNPGFEGNYTWLWLGGIFNDTLHNLNTTLNQAKTSGGSSVGLGILWLLITLIVGAFVCRVNLFAGAIVTIATLAVGAGVGWMTFPTIGGGSTIGAIALVCAVGFAVFGLLYLRDRI